MRSRGARSAVLVLLVVLAMASAGLGAYGLTDHLRSRQHRSAATTAPTIPAVVGLATADPITPSASNTATATPTAPEPVPAALAQTLAPLVASPALGGRVLASVTDADTGQQLYGHGANVGAAPASTAKLLTAVALLASRDPTDRIYTNVEDGGGGTVVLVGGGDPTLTGAAPGKPGAYPDAARLSDLAAQIKTRHIAVTRIVVDDAAFTGPTVSPSWGPGDVPSSYASAITAVMADGGRATPTATMRSSTPDLDAGHELAALLGVPEAPVTRGTPPLEAEQIASVQSAPFFELVGQMLENSDDVIAECLARQVAIAKGAAPSFLGAAAAIRAVVSSLGVDPGGGLSDGSGLAPGDRLAPAVLTEVLDLIVSDENPELHDIVTALPVAAWSGTLQSRFQIGSASGAGAGVIRAKTGTLTSVSALAGLVHDEDGRVLSFALIADQVAPDSGATLGAEAALDRVAAALAGCGCS